MAEVNALPVLTAIGNKNASEHVELAFNASPPIPTMAPPMCWPFRLEVSVLARFSWCDDHASGVYLYAG
ncbi:MAG: hypothetical protein R3C05_21485 [Pirellulaceae bacterium]